MTDYIIRAALHDEANEGWVWIEGFPSRSLIKISNPKNNRNVICQTRKIDNNFRKNYNGNSGRIEIKPKQNTIVMSNWYRDALGGFGTTNNDNSTGQVTLNVRLYRWWLWGQLRAASHHPAIVVRIATRLGVLGIWLGLLGIWLGLLSIFQDAAYVRWIAILGGIAMLLSLGLLIAACWSPNMSPENEDG